MDIGTLSALIFGGLAALLMLGVPFAHAAGAISVVTAAAMFGPNALFIVSSRTYELATSFPIVAVPMFVLMAALLEGSGIARDLYAVIGRATRRLPGGVGLATVAIALVLGATTGIIGGEIVLLGLVALPQMLRLGYDSRLAIGIVCAGGALGTMMPPSIVLIFFGIMTGTPIGDLFLASATPAVLLAALYTLYVLAVARFAPNRAPVAPPDAREDGGPRGLAALRDVGLPVAVAAGVLGSIYLGIASISESAACGVAGVLAATWARGELSRALLTRAVRQTFVTCGVVMWLVFATNALVGVYNAVGGIAYAQSILSGVAQDRASFIAVSVAVFLILGFFLDWIAILFLTLPVFGPMLRQYGIDPVWFGVVFNLTVQIAYLTPPMGPACFYLKSVAPPSITLQQIYHAMWPFIGLQLIGLGLLLAVPDIALWAPAALR
jgi:tripartite ATP-independent transporter DctM subunit